MTNNFKSLALTYKTAPLEIREQVSLNEAAAKRLLNFLRDFTSATDVLVVSTCNRTEIYYSAEKDLSDEIFKGLALIKDLEPGFQAYFAKFEGKAAVQHLFEVAIGLDAQVVGDLQISGQVKNAYQWTADENMAGPFLHRLLHAIFFSNKRVVQETAFRDGAASISYAAKELAEDLTAGLVAPKVLVVGVGEIGQDVCLNLVNSRVTNVTILNRTSEKAERLAQKCGFVFNTLDTLKEEIQKADVIISSVSGTEPLINLALLKDIKILSHKFFIDLSIPRSIEPSIEEIPGAIVYNLDDIQEKTNEAVEKRKASIPKVQAIIHDAIAEFEEWSKEMVVSPTIQKLKNSLEQIRKEELARFLKNANEAEAEKLEEMSKSLMQKILKYPVLQLKAACKRGDAESLSEMLHELFNLEKQSEKQRK
ncbi:glutamyl-tRNA reductase [Chryseosolibacter indicus]|uniref:Glutamyl-tRNA reductase n=1 Tax=Chryseosolibacter indicus TaxID=2782351 RepID=A0ABS5VXD7_9BACT|nr:glutamyl-tRNA reductase [Chryseosolibacter indicus]MBT1705911.1 glutamyl-tRNA reductase [Chryseosolibacter indicus]